MKKNLKNQLLLAALSFLVFFATWLTPPALAQAAAPRCETIFTSVPQTATGYFRSESWGTDLADNLSANFEKAYLVKPSMSAFDRTETLLKFPLRDLVVAPGHKVLRVTEHKNTDVTKLADKKLLLNATVDGHGQLKFLDIWDGHHRALAAYRQGLKSLEDLKHAGFDIQILVNGSPAGSTDVWPHILPASSSQPVWRDIILYQNGQDVHVPGSYSNYELGSRTTLRKLAENEVDAGKRKIGVFFGTFDPVHENHIEVAKVAQHEFHLDTVILIANALPDHKKPTPLGYRQALVLERLKTETTLDAALFDTYFYINNFGKDAVIEKIRQDLGSNNIYLIDGGDSFEKLLGLNQIQPTAVTNYIVIKRGAPVEIPQHLHNKVFATKRETKDVSSTEIRKALGDGQDPDPTKFKPELTKKSRSWGLYKTSNPLTWTNDELYGYLKNAKILADLQFKGGAGSERWGLTYHNNDVWQVLLEPKGFMDYQLGYFKPGNPKYSRIEAEEVAYLLNRQLEMDIVPPTVTTQGYKVGGKVFGKASLSYAVPQAERLLVPENMNDSLELKLFFSDVRVLNILMHNKDANERNLLMGRHWRTGKPRPFIIDFSQSLDRDADVSMDYYPVGHTAAIQVFRKGTLIALKRLNFNGLKKSFGALISDSQINEMLERRDGLVGYIENRVKENPSVLH